MQFDSFQSFIEMGGHGFYVWLCYGFVAVIWLYLALSPTLEISAFFKQEKQRQKRREALEEEGSQ